VSPELAEGVADIGGGPTGEDADDDEADSTPTRTEEDPDKAEGYASPSVDPVGSSTSRSRTLRARSGARSNHAGVMNGARISRAVLMSTWMSSLSSTLVPRGTAKPLSLR
jgi:hypothetical protein